MAKNPRVSVIVPVYNGSEYVSQAIESVLAQTYKDYEIIVADDGSTDATRVVLRQFKDRITVLELKHEGISVTRNKAIAASHGECIALLDADDLWLSGKLERQLAYLDAHPAFVLVYSYSANFTEEGEGTELLKKCDLEGKIFKDLLLGRGTIANSTVMLRWSAFDAVGGYDESLRAMEDYELNLRIARRYEVGRVPELLVRRRIHPGSFYTSGYDNQYTFQLPVFDKLLSDPEIAQLLDTTKAGYMRNFVRKFIYKNLYDDRREFIPQKLKDLERYDTPGNIALVSGLVERQDTSPEAWESLVREFAVWKADVEHKAMLFKHRGRENFNVGAGRL